MKKICTKCKENKSLEEFHRRFDTKNGHKSHCKLCAKENGIKYRQSHKKQIYESNVKYRKNNKEKIRESNTKYCEKNREKINKYYAKYDQINKKKIHERKTRYYEDNKEYIKERNAKYNKSDKGKLIRIRGDCRRRSREANVITDFTTKESKIVMFLQDNKCAYCGETFNDEFKPTLDHIKPVVKGGPLVIDNVQYLCRKHNSEKHTKEIDLRSDYHKYMVTRYINEKNNQ